MNAIQETEADHNFGSGKRPILFETMVFLSKPTRTKLFDRYRMIHRSVDEHNGGYVGGRATTYDQAVKLHLKTVKAMKS